jgi:hypothetical protein
MIRHFLPALGLVLSGCFFVVDDDDPDYDAYLACYDDFDCGGSTPECIEITFETDTRSVTDNMCTTRCRDDYDCPFGGACYEIGGSPAICYERCDFHSDCPPGWGCTDTWGGALDSICLPQ